MNHRTFTSFYINSEALMPLKQQMLDWANRFDICCLLDNHQYNSSYHSYDLLLAVEARHSIVVEAGCSDTTGQLNAFAQQQQDWIFGHINYDFKEGDAPSSMHFDGIEFPELYFFVPQTILLLKGNELFINSLNHPAEQIKYEIEHTVISGGAVDLANVHFHSRIQKAEYIKRVEQLQQHIKRGDCYEINFCQEFYAEQSSLDPLLTYQRLSKLSPAPFAAYYKLNDKYLLCASPERYLKKEGAKLISQPIKGTAKRSLVDEQQDQLLKEQLLSSAKERSENVMIVDLVRNDLSKVCTENSVQVEELFGLYSFPQVHQMISTIRGELQQHLSWPDALRATFPMGSMTGAPKKRVMQLIEEYECSKRGIFSGTVGYITPQGDFDFNVVIRSIMYNAFRRYISCQAGSAITFYSDAYAEYEECLLKISAIEKTLNA